MKQKNFIKLPSSNTIINLDDIKYIFPLYGNYEIKFISGGYITINKEDFNFIEKQL